MIGFAVVSSDLQPYFLDTEEKRKAELSTDQHLVASWICWHRGLSKRPGKPKWVVRLNWEHLVETLVHKVFNSHLREFFFPIRGG